MPWILHDGSRHSNQWLVLRESRRHQNRTHHRRVAERGKTLAMIEYLTSSVFIVVMIKIVMIFGGVMTALAYLTWLERKVMARVQMRPGPTRVGPFGLLQPLADGLKFLFKEDVIPTNANRMLYIAAPVVSLVPALLSFSVIPFGPNLQIADVSVGLLFLFAITSLGVYGIVMGGWASNSKYPLMGAM